MQNNDVRLLFDVNIQKLTQNGLSQNVRSETIKLLGESIGESWWNRFGSDFYDIIPYSDDDGKNRWVKLSENYFIHPKLGPRE